MCFTEPNFTETDPLIQFADSGKTRYAEPKILKNNSRWTQKAS